MSTWLPLMSCCYANLLSAGQPSACSFEHVIIDATPPTNPWIKIVADVDGDGRPDIIIGGSKGPLVWYRNPDWQKFVIAEGGYNTVAGTAIDMDGDGDLDLALGGVVWFENPRPQGDPTKDPWTPHLVEHRRGHDLLAADLDGDGQVELVMRDQSAFGSRNGHSIFIYKQVGADAWSMRELRCGEGEGICLADLNRDGRPDIVIGGSWFENRGNVLTGEWPEHVFTTQWDYPHTKVAVGDLNGDGRLDVILAPAELQGGSHRIAWYEAPADATVGDWTQHVLEEPVETVIHGLAVADFDGDGRLDVAAAHMHQGQSPQEVVLYLNAGGGLKWRRQVLAVTGSHDIVAADLNGDGRPDLVGANHGGPFQAVELWRSTVR